jgi:hypothetical protein
MLPKRSQLPLARKADEKVETTFPTCAVTAGTKCSLIMIGMILYLSNIQRDANFYQTILENEGFPTTTDSIAVGIALSLLTTVVFAPVALFLIGYGFGNCKRLQFVPRLDRFTIIWGSFASLLFVLMLMIEGEYVIYAIQRPQHWITLLASSTYVGFIYVWWCNSLAHGKERAYQTSHAELSGLAIKNGLSSTGDHSH